MNTALEEESFDFVLIHLFRQFASSFLSSLGRMRVSMLLVQSVRRPGSWLGLCQQAHLFVSDSTVVVTHWRLEMLVGGGVLVDCVVIYFLTERRRMPRRLNLGVH